MLENGVAEVVGAALVVVVVVAFAAVLLENESPAEVILEKGEVDVAAVELNKPLVAATLGLAAGIVEPKTEKSELAVLENEVLNREEPEPEPASDGEELNNDDGVDLAAAVVETEEAVVVPNNGGVELEPEKEEELVVKRGAVKPVAPKGDAVVDEEDVAEDGANRLEEMDGVVVEGVVAKGRENGEPEEAEKDVPKPEVVAAVEEGVVVVDAQPKEGVVAVVVEVEGAEPKGEVVTVDEVEGVKPNGEEAAVEAEEDAKENPDDVVVDPNREGEDPNGGEDANEKGEVVDD